MSLAQYQGQVVMINFWASWCGPCRQEMPLLESIYRKYSKMGFTLLGVNVEPDSQAANEWLKQTPVSFPILYDKDSKVSKLYDVAGMPSTRDHRPQRQAAHAAPGLQARRRERVSRQHPHADPRVMRGTLPRGRRAWR